MQRILLPLILLIIFVQAKAQSGCFQTKVPLEVQKFILKDHKVYDYREGDLNGDGRKDAILILQNNKQGEYDSISNDYLDFPIPFMVLIRNNQNKLILKTRNDSILFDGAKSFKGTEIDSRNKRFTLNLSLKRWNKKLIFELKKYDKDFHLVYEEYNSFGAEEDSINDEHIETKEEELIGKTISNLNENDGFTLTNAEVVTEKPYFYNNPDLNSKHRTGYLQKGEIADALYQTVNFVYVFYSGKGDKYSSGFIQKKHLKLTPRKIKTK